MSAEIEIAGGTAFRYHFLELCRKVERGKVVRIVHLQTGCHRGWFTRERPPGCDPVRVTIYELNRASGKVLDDVRDGQVYQIWHDKKHRAVGYVYWSCPEWLAVLLADAPVTYTYKARSGRVVRREFRPLSVRAEPVPPRREAVMA